MCVCILEMKTFQMIMESNIGMAEKQQKKHDVNRNESHGY